MAGGHNGFPVSGKPPAKRKRLKRRSPSDRRRDQRRALRHVSDELGRVAAALRDAERDGRGDDAERHAIALRGREHVAAEGLRYRQRKLQRERDDALLETWAARHDVKLRERESSHRRGPAPDQRPGKGGGMAR